MANINKIRLSGTTYNIQDENATKTVELTQAQYDALSTKDPNTFYIITDATGGDLSNYYTKSETSGATEISTALNAKADTATTYTKTEVDSTITAATSTKQDTLVSGTNIKTINNESILGSGNITIGGGNVSALTDFKVALNIGYDYTSDNISTFYLRTSEKNTYSSGALAYITTTDTNYPSITINGRWSNGAITSITTTMGITSTITNGVAQITLTGGSLVTVDATTNGGGVFLYGQYSSGQTADVVEDTVYDALEELSNNRLDYLYSNEVINSSKTFLWGAANGKPIIFKQSNDSAKIGFICLNSASTNNEIATFEFRPDTYTDSSLVKHPLLYLGHYRKTTTANAGVPQTMVGFRQYDQKGGAAYHYLMPLPADAKTPFSLTTSFKNYFAPMGFKNGSTMITANNTGVVDLSSELGGLKLVKITQSDYDLLSTKDDNTVYFIGDSANGFIMKIGNASVN